VPLGTEYENAQGLLDRYPTAKDWLNGEITSGNTVILYSFFRT